MIYRKYITFLETRNIVAEFVGYNTIISKENIVKICSSVNARIYSNILTILAAEDLVECAFSDEDNQFVFAVTEKGKQKGIQLVSEITN